MSSSVTITDVAEQARVSAASVSMAMRNRPGLSTVTRQRILHVANELGYVPAANHQNRGRKHFGQIGLVVISPKPPRVHAGLGSSYLYALLKGAMDHADKSGSCLSLAQMTFSQLKDGDLPAMLSRPRVDGLIVRSPLLPELQAVLANVGAPCVFVESDRYLPDVAQVQLENVQAMVAVAEHLVGTGARKVATITGAMDHINAQERLAGLQVGLRRRGHSLSEDRIVIESGFDEDSGTRGVRELLRRGVAFDALVCHSDLIATGAMAVLAEAGLGVPEDVRVTGCDNMDFASRLAIPLTTVDTRPHEVGRQAAKLLLDNIESQHPTSTHVKLHGQLIVRQSSQR